MNALTSAVFGHGTVALDHRAWGQSQRILAAGRARHARRDYWELAKICEYSPWTACQRIFLDPAGGDPLDAYEARDLALETLREARLELRRRGR